MQTFKVPNLEPCPFCGHKEIDVLILFAEGQIKIECCGCGASRVKYPPVIITLNQLMKYIIEGAKEWNRRV